MYMVFLVIDLLFVCFFKKKLILYCFEYIYICKDIGFFLDFFILSGRNVEIIIVVILDFVVEENFGRE